MKNIFIVLLFSFLFACENSKQAKLIVKEWMNKEIVFPGTDFFSTPSNEVGDFSTHISDYKIVIYTDSFGCSSCKLQLSKWKMFMKDVESARPKSTIFLFYFSSLNTNEIYRTLLTEKFEYPVCLDTLDSLNKLNHFPSDTRFQTFLLDKNNRVLAIGNPVHNPKVKELYMKIILGDKAPETKKEIKTDVKVEQTQIDFGTFDWKTEQKKIFKLKNTGSQPLVIIDVATSCGCTSALFPKQPIAPGKEAEITAIYKADKPEHFNKTLTVYCNTQNSPVMLRVTGNAK